MKNYQSITVGANPFRGTHNRIHDRYADEDIPIRYKFKCRRLDITGNQGGKSKGQNSGSVC